VYTFRNIRFAAPPIGNLRWAKPAPPEPVSGIQDGSYGPNCIPAPVPPEFTTPAQEKLAETADEGWFFKIQNGCKEADIDLADCLFLDIYVPGKALKGEEKAKLPVIVWMYGGGLVLLPLIPLEYLYFFY
jgi:carboxylesterase type B